MLMRYNAFSEKGWSDHTGCVSPDYERSTFKLNAILNVGQLADFQWRGERFAAQQFQPLAGIGHQGRHLHPVIWTALQLHPSTLQIPPVTQQTMYSTVIHSAANFFLLFSDMSAAALFWPRSLYWVNPLKWKVKFTVCDLSVLLYLIWKKLFELETIVFVYKKIKRKRTMQMTELIHWSVKRRRGGKKVIVLLPLPVGLPSRVRISAWGFPTRRSEWRQNALLINKKYRSGPWRALNYK